MGYKILYYLGVRQNDEKNTFMVPFILIFPLKETKKKNKSVNVRNIKALSANDV